MRDLVVNLVASVVTGVTVWLVQRLLRYRRLARRRAFFGVTEGSECVLVVARHFSARSELSVHRQDVAAVVELAAIIKECGGSAELATAEGSPRLGRATEFCVGGPSANPRTGTHLRALVPGIRFDSGEDAGVDLTIRVPGAEYHRLPGRSEYVVLAKAYGPDRAHPIFLLVGQTAQTNLAAARLLADGYRRLLRTYGPSTGFCLVLRVVEPASYGPDFVEIVADVTGTAFRAGTPAWPDLVPRSSD